MLIFVIYFYPKVKRLREKRNPHAFPAVILLDLARFIGQKQPLEVLDIAAELRADICLPNFDTRLHPFKYD